VKKGDICEAIITQYDFPNKGSFMDEDRKVTIKGALLGQKVRFMVTKRKSGMAEGRLLEVLEKSPLEDSEPYCPYFGMCGGCAYQTMSYANQLKFKEDMVKKLLAPVINHSMKSNPEWQGETIDSVWEGIIPSPVTEGYRNKMEFTFGDEYKDGPLALGLHKKGSFHDILNVSGCKIIGDDWNKILDYSLKYLTKLLNEKPSPVRGGSAYGITACPALSELSCRASACLHSFSHPFYCGAWDWPSWHPPDTWQGSWATASGGNHTGRGI